MRRKQSSSKSTRGTGRKVGLSVLLALATLAAYEGAAGNGFVNFDDRRYVVENPHVLAGLTRYSVAWAFVAFDASNWHPLTWLSLEMDSSMFGTGPRGYHTTNVILHTANAVLLFLVFCSMTGQTWPSWLVAGLFALHPLHVESVAWVAERKDVLSILFWILTLGAYAAYVRRPGPGRYSIVLAGFVLGLLSKPMLVTLPLVLLLLDYWPLARLRAANPPSLKRLLLEKTPLLFLAGISSIITVIAQQGGEAVRSLETFPLLARLENAVVAYALYLGKTVWPLSLGAFYPHSRHDLPLLSVLPALAVLTAISAIAVWQARKRRFLLVGWLWYLGTLVPVIGLLQVGSQALADRYTYIPLVGVFVMVAWMAEEIRQRSRVVIIIELAALAFCLFLTRAQVEHWHDSLALWQHTLEVTRENYLAEWNLAEQLRLQNRLADSIPHFAESLRLKPVGSGHRHLGQVFLKLNKPEEAAEQFRLALMLDPDEVDALNNLGSIAAQKGDIAEAIDLYKQAIRRDPDHALALRNLGANLLKLGKWQEATDYLKRAVTLDPTSAEAFRNLGDVMLYEGKPAEAAAAYLRSLRLVEPNPAYEQVVSGNPKAHYHRDMADALQEQGNLAEARQHYQEAMRLDPLWPRKVALEAWELATSPEPARRFGPRALQLARQASAATDENDAANLDVLAAALAENGRFPEAIEKSRRGLALAREGGRTDLAKDIESRIKLYEGQKPFHRTP